MYSRPTFWLEFRLLSDGLQTAAVHTLPLTEWHQANTPVFSLFPALPTELRLKVWEYMIAPRIVGIACLCLEDGAASIQTQREELWGPHPAVRPAVPVLLHINRETRALALRHYELSFEWKVPLVLAGADLHAPSPLRYTAPSPPPPPLPSIIPQPADESSLPAIDPYAPNISSYHDLLDPWPGSSTLGVGGGGVGNGSERRTAESGLTATTTTTSSSSSAAPPSGSGGDPSTSTTATTTNSTIYSPERRTSSPPRTWFNFALDAVYLLGELEPCDSFGFNSPMAYFIASQTARRVRKAAVSFGALRYGETGGQQIFGALFHVVDRFPPLAAEDGEGEGEVLVCVTERDEWTHAMMGHDTGLVDERYRRHVNARRGGEGNVVMGGSGGAGGGGGAGNNDGGDDAEEANVIQKIWRDWYRGAIVTSPLKNLRFSLIPENDLEHHVYEFMMATPAKPKARGSKGGTSGRDEHR
ncbi:hypothetical protein F4859DRAFT_107403 [Xylaria cf. heliscus]|nr:hypothetical protein F4859DRAFT_107403 [Xylaria cf. heliscus]